MNRSNLVVWCLFGTLALLLARGGAQEQPAVSPEPVPVATIDLTAVLKSHPHLKTVLDLLRKNVLKAEQELTTLKNDIVAMENQLKELEPTSTEYQNLNVEIVGCKATLNADFNRQKTLFAQSEATAYLECYKQVQRVVAEYAQQRGIRVVLRFSEPQVNPADAQSILKGLNAPIVYQHQVDITEAIVARINEGD